MSEILNFVLVGVLVLREILAYHERKEFADRIMSRNLPEFKRMTLTPKTKRNSSPVGGAMTDQEAYMYEQEQSQLKQKAQEEFEGRLSAIRK